MKIAYSYIRFSTPEQAKGDSERRQSEASRNYCKQHGLVLDESLRDLGVSAYRGENFKQGALSRFLAAVDSGAVQPGSLLIVENLDRLSRTDALTALELFAGIVRAGVTVVTLMDGKEYTTASLNANPMDLVYSIMVMSRANEESTKKSRRVAAAWIRKRQLARVKPLTAKCPGWIDPIREGDRIITFRLNVGRSAIVRKILHMGLDGLGAVAISQALNREKVPTLTRRSKKPSIHWEFSTIQYLMRSKTLLGEYQPKRMINRRAVPDGDPIPHYYPALISESVFQRLQAVLDTRKRQVRRHTGLNVANLFSRVLVSGHDNGTMVLQQKRAENINMVSANAVRGLAAPRSFSYHGFERMFLAWIRELDFDKTPACPPTLGVMEGRLAAIQRRISKIKTALETEDGFDHALEVLRAISAKENALKTDLELARGALVTPEQQIAKELISHLQTFYQLRGDENTIARQRVRALIRQLVKQIRVHIYGDRLAKIVVTEVAFHSGSVRRLLILRIKSKGATGITWMDGHDPLVSRLLRLNCDGVATMILKTAIETFTRWKAHNKSTELEGVA